MTSAEDLQLEISRAIAPIDRISQPLDSSPLQDVIVRKVAQLLESKGDEDASKRPRIYLLLHHLDLMRYHTAFHGHTDDYLPYMDWTLPDEFEEEKVRKSFFKRQGLVISNDARLFGPKLKPHLEFKDETRCQLSTVEVLGHGAYGVVDCVQGNISKRRFARKRFFSRGKNSDFKFLLVAFRKEIQALKRLRHHHLVTYIGSYTDPSGTSLIMLPVAECDLCTWLEVRSDHAVLQRLFGCLASAVAFLHREQIRHKDIKPSNILMHGDKAFLTDFGSSLDWKDASKSTTSGKAEAGTRRYAAPEALDREERNSSSDIFSLGCVFLEMATKLCGRPVDSLYQYLKENGTRIVLYGDNEDGVRSWVDELKGPTRSEAELRLLDETLSMLEMDKDKRPKACTLVDDVVDLGAEYSCIQCLEDQSVRHLESIGVRARDPKKRGRALLDAVRKGNLAAFRSLLKITYDLSDKPGSRGTASKILEISVRNNDADEISLKNNYVEISESCLNYCHLKGIKLDTSYALYLAVKKGQYCMADLLLRFGADPTIQTFGKNHPHRSPLFRAVSLTRMGILEKMVTHGADVNHKEGPKERALLHDAVCYDSSDLRILNLLLRNKPDVNITDYKGRTPLYMAVLHGKTDSVILLLDAKANPNVPAKKGNFPIHQAVKKQSLDKIKALLLAGADVRRKDPDGQPPACIAASAGATAILQHILKSSGEIPHTNKHGQNPLHLAVEAQKEETIRMLLGEAPAYLRQRESRLRQTPLHYAAKAGSLSILWMLAIQPNAPTMARDANRDTPSSLARKGDNGKERLRVLKCQYTLLGPIRSRDESHVDADGSALLHLASTKGCINTVLLLLSNGTHLQAQTPAGLTPLHLAAAGGHLQAVQLLLERGASMEIADMHGYTALGQAASNGRIGVAKWLGERVVGGFDQVLKGETQLTVASARGDLTAVSTLLYAGADIDIRNAKGETALFIAIFKNRTEVAKFLIEKGCEVDTRSADDVGRPMLVASLDRTDIRTEIADALMARGISLKL